VKDWPQSGESPVEGISVFACGEDLAFGKRRERGKMSGKGGKKRNAEEIISSVKKFSAGRIERACPVIKRNAYRPVKKQLAGVVSEKKGVRKALSAIGAQIGEALWYKKKDET